MTDAPVIRHLNEVGVAHRTVRYDPALSLEDAALTIGLPASAVCKTLAVASMPAVVLAVLPGSARLDLTALRRHLGENRTMMIDVQALERMTGFRPGAVTPLPRPDQRRFRVVVDAGVMALPELSVGGGEAGLGVILSPKNLLAVTDGETATLAANDDASGRR